MAQFLLLMRGGDEAWSGMSPAQLEEMAGRYFAWSDQLRREDRLLNADELHPGGRTVRARDGQLVVDGPYAETKEGIGGYYLIRAADAHEAAEIAKGCPILGHGGFVDVRAIVER